MVRRIFAIVLIVLGLGTMGAAVASGTIWRPDDQVTLALPTTPDVPIVITAPGVLNAVDNQVDVRVVAEDPEAPVLIAMGRESDVRAWVDDAPHWEVTGLADWEILSYLDSRDEPTADPSASPSEDATDGQSATPTDGETTEATEEATETESPSEDATTDAPAEEEEPLPDPAGSDLWVEEVTGTGEATYTWTAVPGRWVMLIASDGTQPAPQLQLTWAREVETPFMKPGIILGSVLTVLGLGLLIMQVLADLERRRARRASARAATEEQVTVAAAAADGERPLTRREIRLAEAKRRGKTGRTQEIPVTPSELEESEAASEQEGAHAQTGEANELDAWVRTGAASPLLHEGERTTPADLALPPSEEEEETPAAGGDEPAATSEPSQPEDDARPRGRWWRRRRDRAEDEETGGTELESQPDGEDVDLPTGQPTVGDDTEQIPVVNPDEPNPQTSGASWRQTWGLTRHDEGEEQR